MQTWTCDDCGQTVVAAPAAPLNPCLRCGGTRWRTTFTLSGTVPMTNQGGAIIARDPLRDALMSIVVLARNIDNPMVALDAIIRVAVQALAAQ